MNNTIVALGFFDGVHRGHQALLEACRALAAQQGCRPAAITFDRPPKKQAGPMLTSCQDRKLLLAQYGMEKIQVLSVTEALLATPWEAFFQDLLNQGARGFVCGPDFRFGAGGRGTAQALQLRCQALGLPCQVVVPVEAEGEKISSTRIRWCIQEGAFSQALSLLGHPHMLSGTVVPGKQLGRTLGIPTANLMLPEGVQPLPHGVYCTLARTEDGVFPAVTNVGTRPTVSGAGVTVEAWLQGFSGDLYGRSITLEFYKFLRPERPFPSLQALQEEIQKNAGQTMEFFKNP